MTGKKIYLACIVLVLFVFAGSPLQAWETPIPIAVDGAHEYEKPEIGFGPSGTVYISYRNKSKSGGNSDIYLCTYDGKELKYENVSEMSSLWPSHKAYEADIEVDQDERVHVAWIGHDRTDVHTHYIMYRYKDGDTWSQVYELAALPMNREHDACFDTRLGVDSMGNVHVVTFREEEKNTLYVAKYGDTILPVQVLGGPSWSKHPDIAVNDAYVHVMWQQKQGFPYVQMYQKWENKIGGLKSEVQQLTTPKDPYASQKGRIDLDSDGLLHMVDFYKTGTVKNLYYYQERTNGSFAPEINVSNQGKMLLYHWAGLEVRENSVIVTMQLGSSSGGTGVFQNWKKDGTWGGYSRIGGTDGAVHTSVDLSMDGEVAAVAYGRNHNQVLMVSSAPITATGQLEAQFSQPANVFAGSEVTFDASEVTGLNPDYSIVQYIWDFGDGTFGTTSNSAVTHTYNTYGTSVNVKLKIIAAGGEEGETEKDVQLHALYGAIINSVTNKTLRTLFYTRGVNEITWQLNPKNAAAGYPSIASYEVWRVSIHTSMSESDYTKVGDVNAGVTTFRDYFPLKDPDSFVYAVRSVDTEGHISPINNL